MSIPDAFREIESRRIVREEIEAALHASHKFGASYTSNRWRKVSEPDLIISMMTAVDSVGVFVRAPQNGSHADTKAMLMEKATELSEKLSVQMGNSDWHFFFIGKAGDYNDPLQRDELIKWLAETASEYEKGLKEVLSPIRTA